jgi:hypothetical protein
MCYYRVYFSCILLVVCLYHAQGHAQVTSYTIMFSALRLRLCPCMHFFFLAFFLLYIFLSKPLEHYALFMCVYSSLVASYKFYSQLE